ncbi:MAG TPA: LLM class flavin-dependent oxidoreductase [Bryobacteraceae bacterium]|jgi:alkanesulfonate monooxygenase SsuD/methylene tetrahydromethanopterin reductase-like flavin-dependent oxidoreductase (luciferase family)|nr:LLM class flavin-dependent oxidoreductase [Bryobacteraceae bacterium]
MYISTFHLMPHRELPDDFEKRYSSIWVTPPFHELADAKRVGQYYNWTFDELIAAAHAGSDGICTNEHHQNAYGFMPSPNLMGSVLARATAGLDCAIVQMGATLPATQPPTRIAEEYAMLDCISGGRLVAGMPLGTPMDINLCYGVTPIEQRERYREAHDLILKAWTSREPFAWNGKYTQLGMVNLWPRPIQQPHPPVWVPGSGSTSTFYYAAQHNHCYCFLSYFGYQSALRSVEKYWSVCQETGRDLNPHRLGFLQLVGVSETDEQAEKDYAKHVEYFYHKGLHVPPEWMGVPGHQDYQSLANSMRNPMIANAFTSLKQKRFKDFVKDRYVVCGSPATVRDQLKDLVAKLRVGNLMVLLHIGSMPHELTMKNIQLFFREVAPALRSTWDDEWENQWWPAGLRKKTAQEATA